MRYRAHDVRDLCSRCNTANLAFLADIRRKSITVDLKDGSLMKADDRSMDAHVYEHDVGVREATRYPQMVRQIEGNAEDRRIDGSMSLPEGAVEVVLLLLRTGAVKMQQIASEKCCKHDGTGKCRAIAHLPLKRLV